MAHCSDPTPPWAPHPGRGRHRAWVCGSRLKPRVGLRAVRHLDSANQARFPGNQGQVADCGHGPGFMANCSHLPSLIRRPERKKQNQRLNHLHSFTAANTH